MIWIATDALVMDAREPRHGHELLSSWAVSIKLIKQGLWLVMTNRKRF